MRRKDVGLIFAIFILSIAVLFVGLFATPHMAVSNNESLNKFIHQRKQQFRSEMLAQELQRQNTLSARKNIVIHPYKTLKKPKFLLMRNVVKGVKQPLQMIPLESLGAINEIDIRRVIKKRGLTVESLVRKHGQWHLSTTDNKQPESLLAQAAE